VNERNIIRTKTSWFVIWEAPIGLDPIIAEERTRNHINKAICRQGDKANQNQRGRRPRRVEVMQERGVYRSHTETPFTRRTIEGRACDCVKNVCFQDEKIHLKQNEN